MVRSSRRPSHSSLSSAHWGLRLATTPRALEVERAWRLPVVLTLMTTVRRSSEPLRHVADNPVDVMLVVGLLVSALLPASRESPPPAPPPPSPVRLGGHEGAGREELH